MFLNNRHTLVYLSIVTRAQSRGLQKRDQVGYHEWHHVIPLSLGGPDTDENKVLLTAREHFLCHLLLTRMTTSSDLAKMKTAFAFMSSGSAPRQKRPPIKSRWYEAGKKMKGQKKSPEAVAKMKASLTGRTLTEEHRKKIGKNHARLRARDFSILRPNGSVETIHNLREFCAANELDYQLAWLSSKRQSGIKKGPMKGWAFTALP